MKHVKLIQRQAELSSNVIQFCRFLREKGYTISSNEEAEALTALELINLGGKLQFRTCLRATLAKNAYQFEHFNDDFDDYFKQLSKAVDSKVRSQAQLGRNKTKGKAPSLESLKNWLYNKPVSEERELAAYSPVTSFSKKEFSSMDQEELLLINKLIKRVSRQLIRERRRLHTRSKRPVKVDLKSTIRSNMKIGGELAHIRYKAQKKRRYNVVLICDVSRSMELYSKFFIHLMYAFQNAYDKISTWVFSTAIHDVSDLLGYYEFEKAYELISERVPQWSGGTRIGSSLERFNQVSGNWTVNRRTIVFIVSDGWDTGEPEVLSQAMRQIHKRSKRLVWLNPLSGRPSYSPQTTGIKSALPFIDQHASCHNLESLKSALDNLRS